VALLVAATVTTSTFIVTRLSGDLATSIVGPSATSADIEAIRKASASISRDRASGILAARHPGGRAQEHRLRNGG
jgi:hypothetical protein